MGKVKPITANSGFTYLWLVITIAVIGIATAVIGPSWSTVSKIEKEKQLLWTGRQFRQAIKRYYEAKEVPSHQGLKLFPSELKDLMQDPRSPGIHRYLRKIYIDPMTGKADWVLVFDENHRIKGVHSASAATTIKKDNFDPEDEKFRGHNKYTEWVFEYIPEAAAQNQTAGQTQQPAQ